LIWPILVEGRRRAVPASQHSPRWFASPIVNCSFASRAVDSLRNCPRTDQDEGELELQAKLSLSHHIPLFFFRRHRERARSFSLAFRFQVFLPPFAPPFLLHRVTSPPRRIPGPGWGGVLSPSQATIQHVSRSQPATGAPQAAIAITSHPPSWWRSMDSCGRCIAHAIDPPGRGP
jgi:hypothetical protein